MAGKAEVRLVALTERQRNALALGRVSGDLEAVLADVVTQWDEGPAALFRKCHLQRGGCQVAMTGVAPGRTSCQWCIDKFAVEQAAKRAEEVPA